MAGLHARPFPMRQTLHLRAHAVPQHRLVDVVVLPKSEELVSVLLTDKEVFDIVSVITTETVTLSREAKLRTTSITDDRTGTQEVSGVQPRVGMVNDGSNGAAIR